MDNVAEFPRTGERARSTAPRRRKWSLAMRPFLATRWDHCADDFAGDASILDGPVARRAKPLIVLAAVGLDAREMAGFGGLRSGRL
jgi:hypothetical protein